MRYTHVVQFVLCGLLLSSLCAAQSQDTLRDRDGGRNLGDRVGRAIEQAVNRVARQPWWSDDDEAFDAEQDTTPSGKRPGTDIEDLESQPHTRTFTANTTVADSEVVEGNIVVKGANLLVAGKVNGSVYVVGGTLTVKEHGTITGNARVINGDIIREDGAAIGGYADRTAGQSARYRESRKRFMERSTSFDVPWLSEQTDFDHFLLRYNRVEGIFLGAGSNKKYNWSGERRWTSYGSFGYGFKAHTWRGNLGIASQFPLAVTEGHHLLEVGAEGYSLTDTKDQWLIGTAENSMAAFFLHEDFRDYFQREGVTVHGSYFIMNDPARAEVTVSYIADRYASLRNRVEWALFGGDKIFRTNPAVNTGKMRGVTFFGGYTTVSRSVDGPEGWTITGSAEIAKAGMGSEYDFDRYLADVRRYQPLGEHESLNLRLRAGSNAGDLTVERAFDLGGLGSLNAFPFKEESGNRMILFNAEFIVNGNILDDLDFWPTWVFRHVNFILLSDAGLVRRMPPAASASEGFSGIHWNEFRHDFGFGVSNRSGSFRMGVTWRTDRSEPVRFLFRVYRPF